MGQAPTGDQPAPSDEPPADGATPAGARTAPAAIPPPATTPAPGPAPGVARTPDLTDEELKKLAEQEAKEEVITVTGSLLERREVTTVAPVAILRRETLDQSGLTTVGDILQQLPSQSNAINAQTNNGGDGSTRVNLRGLGVNRTLTLINGRRVVASGIGADASVDINTIPLAMIDRIEVLKDGASAVYGSDAIGGVVNVITRSGFNGTEVALYTGGSQRGDGNAYDASFVTGFSSEKGHVLFSAGYQDQEPVFAGERGFSTFDKVFDFKNREEVVGGSLATPGGRIDTSVLPNNDTSPLCTTPGPTGLPVPARFCTRDPALLDSSDTWVPFGPLYNYQPVNYLYTPSTRYNVAGEGTYDIARKTHVFFEGNYMNRVSDQQLAPEPLDVDDNDIVISKDSVYNKLGVDIPVYRRRLVEFGPRRSLQNVDSFRLVTGVGGQLPDDLPALRSWKWEVSYNHGRTNATQRNEGNLIVNQVATALGPSFIDGAGVPRCGTQDFIIPDCVPMDILGGAVNNPFDSSDTAGSISRSSPGAIANTTYTGISSGFNQEQAALATAHGRLMATPWGGDIGLVVGGGYRKEAGGFTPDPLTASGDTTGNAAQPTSGSYNVLEGFAELSLVPVVNQGLAQWVELDLAARAFTYSTVGSGVTWKAGGLFRTLGGLAVRGTYSTAFHAPSIPELYAGAVDSFPTAEDPCDTRPPSLSASPTGSPVTLPAVVKARCEMEGVPADADFRSSQQRTVGGGNANLRKETAQVATAGIAYQPPEIKGLAATLDYFHINIDDAIQQLSASVILGNCYTFNLEKYCAAIHRDAQRAIDFIDDPITNVEGSTTSGLDAAITYDHEHAGIGRFRHSLEGTYLLSYQLTADGRTIDGLGVYDLGVNPRLKASFNTTWGLGSAGAGVNVRYIGSIKECVANSCDVQKVRPDLAGADRTVPANVTADLYGSYSVKSAAGLTTLSVGINNVLDQDPPLIYVGLASDSDASTYSYMGRFFYARLAQRF